MGEIGKKPEASERLDWLRANLHPQEMHAVLMDSVRGGLPSSSLPDGSRSADHPMPHLDRHDVEQLQILAAYGLALKQGTRAELAGRVQKAVQHLQRAHDLETGVLLQRHMSAEEWRLWRQRKEREAAEEINPRAVCCGNGNCARPVARTRDDPLCSIGEGDDKVSRCRRCHRFWHGL